MKRGFYENGIRMIPTEEEEQAVVIRWCQLFEGHWPELRLIYHIPNEGKRSARAGGYAKGGGAEIGSE